VEEDGSVRGSNVSSSDDEFALFLENFSTMLLSLLPDFTSSTGRLLPLFPALLSFDNGKHLLRFGDDS
jgi:hypothetical protein